MWPTSFDEWPNTREDFIYDWWMSVSHLIPKNAKLQADHWHVVPDTQFMEMYLKHNFDEPVFYGPKRKPANEKQTNNPSHDIATRRAIQIGVRRLAPRFVPYVGWGLLAKDIYDYLSD